MAARTENGRAESKRLGDFFSFLPLPHGQGSFRPIFPDMTRFYRDRANAVRRGVDVAIQGPTAWKNRVPIVEVTLA